VPWQFDFACRIDSTCFQFASNEMRSPEARKAAIPTASEAESMVDLPSAPNAAASVSGELKPILAVAG
jgi:hypothetical protein